MGRLQLLILPVKYMGLKLSSTDFLGFVLFYGGFFASLLPDFYTLSNL